MTCQELKNLIENSLPGERDATAVAEARQHAATCPACAAALADMLRLEEALTRLPGIEADEQLTQSVMNRIACLSSRSARSRVHRDWLALSLMAAGSLLLALVYWWTAAWSQEWARLFDISIGPSWSASAARISGLGIETLLLTLLGAASIIMGLTCEGTQPVDVSG
jgi:anti-sigma factor RsiW